MNVLFFLIGCFSINSKIDFEPTSSMCVDATVVNMRLAGCNDIYFQKTGYGITKISCNEETVKKLNDWENPSWINNDFFSVPLEANMPSDVTTICTDPFIIMATAEKD